MGKSIGVICKTACLICFLAASAIAQTSQVQREARLLDEPKAEGVVLDILVAGMTLEVVDVQGGWAKVRIPATSEMGWVETAFLSQAQPPSAAANGAGGEPMTDDELERVRERAGTINQSIDGLEGKVDALLRKMEGREEMPAPGGIPSPEPGREAMPAPAGLPGAAAPYPGEMEAAGLRGEVYRWRNAFVMGQYMRGGQNFFGLTFGRLIDEAGHVNFDGRAQYALGEIRGSVDDFIDWTFGLDFNIFPQRYRIYPYLGAHFGMRNLLEDSLPDRNFIIASPVFGITAELSRIFSASAEVRGVFLFAEGRRRDEGTVSFFFGYCY